MKILQSIMICSAGIAIIIVAVGAIFFVSSQLPGDKQVVQKFNAQKSVLIKLGEMLSQEPQSIVGITDNKVMFNETSNWILPEKAGISAEHFLEYRSLMTRAGITQVWRSDDALYYNFAATGFASYGWRLSFARIPTIPSPLVPSIDSVPSHTWDERGPVYQSLGDHWYIRLIY